MKTTALPLLLSGEYDIADQGYQLLPSGHVEVFIRDLPEGSVKDLGAAIRAYRENPESAKAIRFVEFNSSNISGDFGSVNSYER